MLSSIIIITPSQNQDERIQLANQYSQVDINTPSTDVFLLADSTISIGIDTIRNLIRFFNTKPSVATTKTAILLYAETITPVAQHSLLKILEEPPEFAQIILLSPHTHTFLPTILSRCQTIRTQTNQQISNAFENTIDLLGQLLTANPGQKISISDYYNSDRIKSQQLTLELIHYFRQQLSTQHNQPTLYNLTLSLYVSKLLKQNVNPKLALDYLFFNLKKP